MHDELRWNKPFSVDKKLQLSKNWPMALKRALAGGEFDSADAMAWLDVALDFKDPESIALVCARAKLGGIDPEKHWQDEFVWERAARFASEEELGVKPRKGAESPNAGTKSDLARRDLAKRSKNLVKGSMLDCLEAFLCPPLAHQFRRMLEVACERKASKVFEKIFAAIEIVPIPEGGWPMKVRSGVESGIFSKGEDEYPHWKIYPYGHAFEKAVMSGFADGVRAMGEALEADPRYDWQKERGEIESIDRLMSSRVDSLGASRLPESYPGLMAGIRWFEIRPEYSEYHERDAERQGPGCLEQWREVAGARAAMREAIELRALVAQAKAGGREDSFRL